MRFNMKLGVCFLILFTFLGSSFPIITVGGVTLYAFRLYFLLFFIVEFINNNMKKNRITISTIKSFSVYYKMLVIFYVILMFTLIFTPNLTNWVSGFLSLIINLLIIHYIVKYTNSEEDLKLYLKMFAVGVLINALISVYEYVTHTHIVTSYLEPFAINSDVYQYLAEAPTAFLYNPNNIAVVFVIGIVLGKYLVNKERNLIKGNIVSLLYVVLCIVVIFMTGSRGGILFSILAVFLDYVFNKNKFFKKVIIFMFSALLTVGVIHYFQEFIFKQFQYSGIINIEKEFILFSNIDGEDRFDLIRQGLKVTSKTLYLGGGPNGYEGLTGKYYGYASSAHNFWIETLSNYGIVGLLTFSIFYLKNLKEMYKLSKVTNCARDIGIMLILFALTTTIPPSIFSLPTIWTIFGYSLACQKIYDKGILMYGSKKY